MYKFLYFKYKIWKFNKVIIPKIHTYMTWIYQLQDICNVHCRRNFLFQKQVYINISYICVYILYCIVLKGWSLLSIALRPLQIYCAPPNLDITRTLICRLYLAQRPIFQAWGSLTSTCAQEFYVLKKSIDLSRVWTRESWMSRGARYPETTEADCVYIYVYT